MFLGCPAEERGSGKAQMIEDGLFDGIDAALLFHPCDRNHVESQPLASEDVDIVFTGLQAHAASDPWKGHNALDAMILLFSSVGLWRQQLRPDARVHGIIQEGGTAANIIPDRTRAWFMLRSAEQAYYEVMKAPLLGARATPRRSRPGRPVEVTFSGGAMTMNQNRTLEARWVANAAAYGIEDQGPDPNSGSTDMANVSWVCPTIHPELAICERGRAGPLDPRSATPPRRHGPTRRPCWRRRSSRRRRLELFADPALVEAAWARVPGAEA